MYAYLEGKFKLKSPALLYVDINGLGYEVHISLHTYGKIQHLQKGRVLTYLQVLEDDMRLFGFYDEDEKTLFLQLISISGVGASTARMMLSGMEPAEIIKSIATQDAKSLERIKGIGAKTAQRIVLELKDKVTKASDLSNNISISQNNFVEDALNALISLGIAKNTAYNAVQKVVKRETQITNAQDLIKLSLKEI